MRSTRCPWTCFEKHKVSFTRKPNFSSPEENSEAWHSQEDSYYLNPVYQAEQEKEGFSSGKNIVDALCHLVKQQSAPDIELDVFDGNPLDFDYFMTLFR